MADRVLTGRRIGLDRYQDVLERIGRGETMPEIARALDVSQETIRRRVTLAGRTLRWSEDGFARMCAPRGAPRR